MSRVYRAPRRLSRRFHRRGGRRNRAAADTAILSAAPQAGRLRPQVTAVSSEHPAGLLPTAPPLPHPRSSLSRPPPPPDLGWGLVPFRTAPSRPPLELLSVSFYLLAGPRTSSRGLGVFLPTHHPSSPAPGEGENPHIPEMPSLGLTPLFFPVPRLQGLSRSVSQRCPIRAPLLRFAFPTFLLLLF